MASVAVPLIASFVVQKVGESQGWDPRFTAVASMVAGFGAGSMYSAAAAVGTGATAATAGTAGTAARAGLSVNPHMGMGAKAVAMGTTGGAPSVATGIADAGKSWGYAPTSGAHQGIARAFDPMTGRPTMEPWTRYIWNQHDGPVYAKAAVPGTPGTPANPGSTLMDELKNEWGDWTDRTTYENVRNPDGSVSRVPVMNADGTPHQKPSAADNFGVSALKTLMKPLPEKAPIRSGGSGGGPQAPAYQAGGQSAPYQTVWSFGQPNQGYKPQGI